MSIYAIGDLHLPGNETKPMDVFGPHWERHFEKIAADWRARVTDADAVLLPGDISWAMYLQDALCDLQAIDELPGKKFLLRGNHDYWWNSLSKVRAALPKGMVALQNDAWRFGDVMICGARGWTAPGDSTEDADQEARIYRRELIRLEISLTDARRQMPEGDLVAMLHYPPFNERHEPTEVTGLLKKWDVREVVYGHLHGASLRYAFSGLMDGILYHQVSCDGLGFQLMKLETGA